MNLVLSFGITFWEMGVEQRRVDNHNLKGNRRFCANEEPDSVKRARQFPKHPKRPMNVDNSIVQSH